MPNTASLGKAGEEQAAAALEAKGMKIICRNYRSKAGEIDIIALDGETVVFVEVKAWSSYGLEDLQYSLNDRKKHKIIKTANYFLSENRKYSNMTIRFDVVFVNNSKTSEEYELTHLASAFMESV